MRHSLLVGPAPATDALVLAGGPASGSALQEVMSDLVRQEVVRHSASFRGWARRSTDPQDPSATAEGAHDAAERVEQVAGPPARGARGALPGELQAASSAGDTGQGALGC